LTQHSPARSLFNVRRAFAFVLVASVPVAILASSCTTNSAVGEGGACFQAIDCQLGLICKYVNDAGTCTKDLTGLNTLPAEAGGDAPQQQDSANDAPVMQDTGTKDTGTQDTGVQDTGVQDTGTQDTGATDAGNG
jgi:hypothetical protein